MKFAFVLPRFGEGIIGGNETLVGSLATKLAARGDTIEVWTTCAKDNRTWLDEYPRGASIEFGVKTIRFATAPRNLDVWIPLELRLHDGGRLTVDEELTWMQQSVTSPELFAYIAQESKQFDMIFFVPYLFGTTFWGALIDPERSALIPCLHDEPYAYTQVSSSLFRQVRGALFNAYPEMTLARELYGPISGGVVGMGFDPEHYAENYAPYFENKSPYLVYAGRKETGKNVHRLIDFFTESKDAGLLPEDVTLVILGGGSFSDILRPDALSRSDIIDLPPLSEDDKRRVIKNAVALVQPSTKESFSIVLMESWLLSTPTLVHGEGAVTRHHVVESGGGLYFSSTEDFAAVVHYYLADEERRKAFGKRGYDYVTYHYSWPAVLGRFDAAVSALISKTPPIHVV